MNGGSIWMLTPAKMLTEEQFGRILDAARPRTRDWTLLFLCGATGLRISEVLHLHVCDFERPLGVKVVRRKKRRLAPELLPVAGHVFDFVTNYVAATGLAPDAWIFPGECGPCERNVKDRPEVGGQVRRQRLCDGGHLSIRRGQIIWDRAILEAGLKVPGRGVHSARHLFATRFYAKTRDLRSTQLALGHASPLTTQVYAHVVDLAAQAEAVGVVTGSRPAPAGPIPGTGPAMPRAAASGPAA